jgi:hypothetical protein
MAFVDRDSAASVRVWFADSSNPVVEDYPVARIFQKEPFFPEVALAQRPQVAAGTSIPWPSVVPERVHLEAPRSPATKWSSSRSGRPGSR